MLISIHDSSLRRVAYMDNVVPLAMHYADDTWRRLLKEATSTFTFKVDMLGRESEQYLTDDAYISFKYNNRQYLFNVMTITPDSGSKSIIVYCENLSLELLNETKAPIDVTTSRNLLWYLNNDSLLNNAGLTLGVNEVSDKTAKIKLDSEQTGLARLTSIANNFDAEIEFVTELNGDGTLKSMTVNFFKKYDGVSQGVGTYRRDLILEYGRNVDGIKRTIDKTDLYNEITPTGKDGLNITSLEKEEYDENGNLEFYTKSGSQNIFAPQSKARYRAQLLNDTDGWLRRYYPADGTSNVNTLYTLALNELKKHAYPAITYEVTGFYDLDIGDTVRIVDRSFTPTLIVQARVAEQSICFSDPTKNKTTFGNILALESRVSQDLTGRLKELVDQVTPYRFEIVSDNGLTFKNSEGNTTLTARVYKGSNVQEVSVDSFEWLLDGVKFGGTAKSQLVNSGQVNGTAVVRYNAKIGDTVIGGIEVTLQDVSDGTITHTAYANSADGTDGFTTVYPNSNLLDGTKDFSGVWWSHNEWETDGTYKGLTVKKRIWQWQGISKPFTAQKDGVYTFSGYVKGSGSTATIYRFVNCWDIKGNEKWLALNALMGNSFDWLRDSFTVNLKTGDTLNPRYEISGAGTDSIVWTAGHKWEPGSIATPYMQSASEVTTADWPKYRGEYSDISSEQSTNPSNYTWTIVRGNDGTDGVSPTVKINPDTSLTIIDAKGTITTPVLKGSDGTDGTSGIIVSSVSPNSPQNGQLWQDTSTMPQLVKKWTGESWVIWELYAQNLKADTLETISAKIGKLSNTYTVDYGTGVHTGTVTIENGMKIVDDTGISRTITDFTSQSSGQGMFARYLPDKSDTAKYQQAWYTPFSLRFDDTVNDWHGQISAEALHNKGWKNVTGFINGVQADAVPLQYKVTINMDNTRTIKFRGGFKGNGTSDIPQAGIVQLPAEARPTTTIAFPCMGSGARIARIIIATDGWIQFNVANGSSISGFNGVLLSNVFYEI